MKGMKIVKITKIFGFSKPIFMSFTSFMFFMFCALAAQQKPPIFRTKVDLMQLDVSVLDKKGQPVRGLTKDDFTLLVDDKAQSIEGFTAADLPDRETGGPVWDSAAAHDVATNEIDNHRIFVIVLDDGRSIGLPSFQRRETIRTAEAFVELMGPKDLAAVVFTEQVKLSQNLTNDRARLLKAIRSLPLSNVTSGQSYVQPVASVRSKNFGAPCNSNKETLQLFQAIVEHLSTLPDRRKAIVYYGYIPWAQQPTDDDCGTYWAWRDVFTAAQLGHVSINPVLPGVVNPPEHYLAIAENTGGHAVVGSNDSMPGLRRVLVENSSYYLLAYQPQFENDGRFRRFTVKVNRPDVEVITRRGYWSPRPPDPSAASKDEPSPQVAALAGVLPLADLGLRATAMPFAAPDGTRSAVVALSIGVQQRAFAGRTPDQIDLLVKAFTPDGDERASDQQTIPITVPAPPRDVETSRYEVLARIDLPKPGKYELRLTAHSSASDTRGSVYVDVDVPDFQKDKLSLSGIVVHQPTATTPAAPLRLLRDVTPIVPTTERAFGASDIVTTLTRVYQRGNDKVSAVEMTVTIKDAAGKTAFTASETMAVDRFVDKAADYQFRLPLDKLQAGQYLLTFEAAAGKNAVRRDIRFEKK